MMEGLHYLLTACTYLFIAFVSYGIYLCFYRLFFHPLAKFPGPKLAAATYWYECYADLIIGPFPGQGAYHIERLHKRYGPIVRISPDELSLSNPEWFEILYQQGRRDKWAKNSNANGSPGSVASTPSWHMHKARRAPLSRFFSVAAIRDLERIIEHKVNTLTDGVRNVSKNKRVLRFDVAATALTLDVITDYCFGQSWGCLEDPNFAPEWKQTMTSLFEAVPVSKQFPWILAPMSALPLAVIRMMDPNLAMFFGAKIDVQKQVTRMIAEHEGKGKGNEPSVDDSELHPSRTIFETILRSSLPPAEKTVERLTDEAFVMVVAGGETTAKVLSNTLFHLLANPDWKRQVLEELEKVMPDVNKLPTWNELEKLPVLTASIKETLRMSAPVTNRVQLLDSERPLTFGDWIVPPGTPMSMSIPALHLDPTLYPDPNTFNPGRFLPKHSSAEAVQLANKYYMPFQRGARNCLGQNLAYAELYLGVAAMLRRFELALDDVVRERDIDTVRDCFVGMPSPKAKGVNIRVLGLRS